MEFILGIIVGVLLSSLTIYVGSREIKLPKIGFTNQKAIIISKRNPIDEILKND